jgi:hypothetical protein
MQGNATNTDEFLTTVPDWQRKNLEQFRDLVHQVCSEITEEIKWGVPVFLLNGKMVLAMSSFKAHTKYNFIANGAKIGDPKGLFNNGLESKKSRGIDLKEGETLDQDALKALIQQAIEKM